MQEIERRYAQQGVYNPRIRREWLAGREKTVGLCAEEAKFERGDDCSVVQEPMNA